MMKVGTRVKFTEKVQPVQFGCSAQEWEENPKTGTVIECQIQGMEDKVFVEMDKEFLYNEKDLICWLQGSFEVMEPDEVEEIAP